MTQAFVIRPEAEADILETFNWYEDQSLGLGEEFLSVVGEGLGGIREAPQRYPVVYREPAVEVRRVRLKRFPYALCCGELHLTVLSSQRIENSTACPESPKPSTERGQLHERLRLPRCRRPLKLHVRRGKQLTPIYGHDHAYERDPTGC